MVVPLLIFVVLWISKQKALSEGMPLFATSNFIYHFLFSISLGSSRFFMRSVFVMCTACLAGTALMIMTSPLAILCLLAEIRSKHMLYDNEQT